MKSWEWGAANAGGGIPTCREWLPGGVLAWNIPVMREVGRVGLWLCDCHRAWMKGVLCRFGRAYVAMAVQKHSLPPGWSWVDTPVPITNAFVLILGSMLQMPHG